jgi:hypothetical protein
VPSTPADRADAPAPAAIVAQFDELKAQLLVELEERRDLLALCKALVDDEGVTKDRNAVPPYSKLLVPSRRVDDIADLLDRIDAREV